MSCINKYSINRFIIYKLNPFIFFIERLMVSTSLAAMCFNSVLELAILLYISRNSGGLPSGHYGTRIQQNNIKVLPVVSELGDTSGASELLLPLYIHVLYYTPLLNYLAS